MGVEVFQLEIAVIQADGLAARDSNFFGMQVSSDPYVEVRLCPQGESTKPNDKVFVGKTSTIMKTLSPVWENPLIFTVELPTSYFTDDAHFELTILDFDECYQDNKDYLMGVVPIHIPTHLRDPQTTYKWYGVPASSANGAEATGRVHCMMSVQRGIQEAEEVEEVTELLSKQSTNQPTMSSLADLQDTSHSTKPLMVPQLSAKRSNNHKLSRLSAEKPNNPSMSRLSVLEQKSRLHAHPAPKAAGGGKRRSPTSVRRVQSFGDEDDNKEWGFWDKEGRYAGKNEQASNAPFHRSNSNPDSLGRELADETVPKKINYRRRSSFSSVIEVTRGSHPHSSHKPGSAMNQFNFSLSDDSWAFDTSEHVLFPAEERGGGNDDSESGLPVSSAPQKSSLRKPALGTRNISEPVPILKRNTTSDGSLRKPALTRSLTSDPSLRKPALTRSLTSDPSLRKPALTRSLSPEGNSRNFQYPAATPEAHRRHSPSSKPSSVRRERSDGQKASRSPSPMRRGHGSAPALSQSPKCRHGRRRERNGTSPRTRSHALRASHPSPGPTTHKSPSPEPTTQKRSGRMRASHPSPEPTTHKSPSPEPATQKRSGRMRERSCSRRTRSSSNPALRLSQEAPSPKRIGRAKERSAGGRNVRSSSNPSLRQSHPTPERSTHRRGGGRSREHSPQSRENSPQTRSSSDPNLHHLNHQTPEEPKRSARGKARSPGPTTRSRSNPRLGTHHANNPVRRRRRVGRSPSPMNNSDFEKLPMVRRGSVSGHKGRSLSPMNNSDFERLPMVRRVSASGHIEKPSTVRRFNTYEGQSKIQVRQRDQLRGSSQQNALATPKDLAPEESLGTVQQIGWSREFSISKDLEEKAHRVKAKGHMVPPDMSKLTGKMEGLGYGGDGKGDIKKAKSKSKFSGPKRAISKVSRRVSSMTPLKKLPMSHSTPPMLYSVRSEGEDSLMQIKNEIKELKKMKKVVEKASESNGSESEDVVQIKNEIKELKEKKKFKKQVREAKKKAEKAATERKKAEIAQKWKAMRQDACVMYAPNAKAG